MTAEEKRIKSALDVIDKINPLATYLNDSTLSSVDEWIDTGSYVLNAIISGKLDGGVPKGRVTMLAGESMTGKTLFLMKILANAQKNHGLTPVIFDTENAIDAESALRCGLDLAKVKYVPCISIEQTKNALFKFLEMVKEKGLQGKFIVAIDSLGNLQSEIELKRMTNDNVAPDMGTRARAMKGLLQVCTNNGAVTGTTVICTNHVYDDPSAMYPSIEKNMPGGKAAVFLPSVTVQLARKPVDTNKDGGKTNDDQLAAGQKKFAGVIIRALTRKNRFIMQYLEGEMYLSFSTGLDRYFGLLELAKGLEVIHLSGKSYRMGPAPKDPEDKSSKSIGYYKNFRKDTKLWEETLLPLMQEKMAAEWSYSDGSDGEDVLEE